MFFFRVSSNKGLGHLMRSLNISMELRKKNIKTVFFTEKKNNALSLIIKKNTNDVFFLNKKILKSHKTELDFIINIVKFYPENTFLIDNYDWNYKYQKTIHSFTKKLIVISDETKKKKFFCDYIINPNQQDNLNFYKKITRKKTQILSGKNISLVNCLTLKEKKRIYKKRKEIKEVKNILISFGGNTSIKNINSSLNAISRVNIKPKAVYITSSIPIKNFKKRKFKIIILNKIYNLDKYYKICDICIGSCGHSTWERAANLLPTISVELAQNQNLISKYIKKTNIGFVIKSKNQKEIEIFIVKKLKLIINVSNYMKIIKKLKKVITRNNLTQLVNKII